MGWWSKREPVYSEAGTHLYTLLTQRWFEWESTGAARLSHKPSRIWLHGFDTNIIWVYHSETLSSIGVRFDSMLTKDDQARLVPLAKQVHNRLNERAVMKAIGNVTNTFDQTALTLAKAVIEGDKVAARALIDHLVEVGCD